MQETSLETEQAFNDWVLKHGTKALALKLLAVLSTGGLYLLLARVLTVEEYGVYVYALSWATVLAMVARVGLTPTLVRYTARYRIEGSWIRLNSLIYVACIIVTIVSLSVVLLAGVAVWLMSGYMGASRNVFWAAMIVIVPLALMGIPMGVLRGLREIVRTQLQSEVLQSLFLAALLGALLIVGLHLTAFRAMILTAIAVILALLVGMIWVSRRLPAVNHLDLSKKQTFEWIKVSSVLLVVGILHIVLHRTDILMLGALIGADRTGPYQAATILSEIVLVGVTALNMIVGPAISELHATKRWQTMRGMATSQVRVVSSLAMITSLALIVAGEELLGLFGPDFGVAYNALVVLVVGHTLNALMGSVGLLLAMTGYETRVVAVMGIAALLNVLLNAALIPRFGMLGGAAATAITAAVWNVLLAMEVKRRLGINSTVFVR